GCLRHICGASALAVSVCSGAGAAAAVCSFTLMRGADSTDGAGGASVGGGGALSVAVAPNCCWMIMFTAIELSAPQFWQTSCTGCATISGVTSNAYFVPQLH